MNTTNTAGGALDLNKSRAEFEAWAFPDFKADRNEKGFYSDPLTWSAWCGWCAARAGVAADTGQTEQTDIARRLRTRAAGAMPNQDDAKLMAAAADECDRFYNGMMAWKRTAQAKDREALAAPAAAQDEWISVEDRLPEQECLAVYVTPNGKQRLIRAKYARQYQIEAEGDDCETEYNEDDDTFYIKAGWLECIDNWGEYSSCYVTEGTVTHWKPSPALPAIAAQPKDTTDTLKGQSNG